MKETDNQHSEIILDKGTAFQYLKSLPKNLNRVALKNRTRKRGDIIDDETAQDYTNEFRTRTTAFSIPIAWVLDKDSLVNLLGITSYDDYPEVIGIRFYAGINEANQLTLIAVSTKAGTGCHDDLTENEEYPYYDYADPCPNNCSNIGSLKVQGGTPNTITVVQTT